MFIGYLYVFLGCVWQELYSDPLPFSTGEFVFEPFLAYVLGEM